MFLKYKPFFLLAETPLHPGSGTELRAVDLPIQRERYTGFPKIESSGLKGCLRDAFEIKAGKDLTSALFGPEPEEGVFHAGCLSFLDARILLFPVKSLKGVFAWITCPMVISRFIEDMQITGKDLPWYPNDLVNTVPPSSSLLIDGDKVVLEEYAFPMRKEQRTGEIAQWFSQNIFPNDGAYNYWREKLKKDLVVLSDDDFTDFVNTSTEVVTRIRINDALGTVKEGALWTEEYLPQDTVLYSLVMASPPRLEEERKKEKLGLDGSSPKEEVEKVLKKFEEFLPPLIQLGGNQTIGKGLVRIKLMEVENEQGNACK